MDIQRIYSFFIFADIEDCHVTVRLWELYEVREYHQADLWQRDSIALPDISAHPQPIVLEPSIQHKNLAHLLTCHLIRIEGPEAVHNAIWFTLHSGRVRCSLFTFYICEKRKPWEFGFDILNISRRLNKALTILLDKVFSQNDH